MKKKAETDIAIDKLLKRMGKDASAIASLCGQVGDTLTWWQEGKVCDIMIMAFHCGQLQEALNHYVFQHMDEEEENDESED
ncbi:MAG: hypothetical protein SOI44_00510 [Lactimicrobium sp.]|jgi:hypothetical protein|uniref:hypothetical protein n=1 Tax=Lactimicrobium sp. TaxID=2563780 RepID=UPI002F356599